MGELLWFYGFFPTLASVSFGILLPFAFRHSPLCLQRKCRNLLETNTNKNWNLMTIWVYRVSPSLGCPLVLSGEQFLCYYSKSPVNSTTKCIDFAIHSFWIYRANNSLNYTAEALFFNLDSSVLNIQSIVWCSHSLTCDIKDCIVGRSWWSVDFANAVGELL